MKSLLIKGNDVKIITIKLLLCFFFTYFLVAINHLTPSHLRKIVKTQTQQCSIVKTKKYDLSEIDIAKIAEIESKSIYAQRKPKKKPRNPASDEGRKMMANNNYHQIKEKV